MKILKSIKLTALSLGLWALPSVTKAVLPISNPSPGILPEKGNIVDLVTFIINVLLAIAGIIAVLFIIIGGFQYITSAGSSEQAEAGKKTIQNSIIGLIIIILSFVIVNVINRTIGRI